MDIKKFFSEATRALAKVPDRRKKSREAEEGKKGNLLPWIGEMATALWRLKQKMDSLDEALLDDKELKALRRHCEGAWDCLLSGGVEVKDHVGDRYVAGMAVKVMTFQPTPSIRMERITEAIKPTVYFRGALVQRGEVIVATPAEEVATPSEKDATPSEKVAKPSEIEE